MEFKHKYLKFFEKEYKSKFKDHRNENVDEKEKFFNENLSKLPINHLKKQKKKIR